VDAGQAFGSLFTKPNGLFRPKKFGRIFCIGRENKPPAMQVCSQIALASSKTSCSIMSAGSPTARNYTKGVIQNGQKQFSTYNVGM